jgi:L-threonylcarbamoyladenylate synthase
MRVFDLRTGRSCERDDAQAIELARAELKDGHGVISPTDTVFGLLADARNRASVAQIATIKQRASSTPPPVLIDSVEMATSLVNEDRRPLFARIAELWPGPLSVVIDVDRSLGESVNPGIGTVALRVPAPAWLRALCSDLPLAASSANLHGQPTPSEVTEVIAGLRGADNDLHPWLTLALDRAASGAVASTVIDLSVDPPRVLRHGALPCAEVRHYLPQLECRHAQP